MQEADKLGHNLEIVYKSKVSDCQLPKDGDDYVRIKVGDGLELSTSLLVSKCHFSLFICKCCSMNFRVNSTHVRLHFIYWVDKK